LKAYADACVLLRVVLSRQRPLKGMQRNVAALLATDDEEILTS
jgi:hypothetical protein